MGSIFPVASAAVFREFLRLYCPRRCRIRITAASSPARWRFLCFTFGVFLASIFWVTPLAHLDHKSLTGHMVQHVLLMTVTAPLILIAEPILILRQSVPQWAAGSFDKPRRQRSLDSGVQSSMWLVSCWMAGTATVIWWHIPSVFAFTMHSHVGHEIEKTTFFLGGLCFWSPVLRQWADRERTPQWSIVFYLFLATLPCDVLSAFLTFCGRVAYASYASGPESMQSAALRDQERAGALMWTWVTFAYLTPAVLIAIAKLSGSSALGSQGRHQPPRSPGLAKTPLVPSQTYYANMAAPAALLLPRRRNSLPAAILTKADDIVLTDITMPLPAPPIRIGYSLSLTGPVAGNSRSAKIAHDIWREDVNARGGLLGRRVELICHDDHADASLVPDIYKRLMDIEGVDIVIGGYGTSSLIAAMPLVIERQRFFIGLMGLGVNNTFHYPNYFAMIPTGSAPNASLTEGFFELGSHQSPKPETIALLSAEAEFSLNPIIGAKENAKKYAFRIVRESVYPLSTTNFVPVIDKVAESQCDILFLCSYLSDSVELVRAIRSHAFRPKMVGGAMIGPQNTAIKTMLGPPLNGFVNYEYWVPSPQLMFPGVQELLEAYQTRVVADDVDPLGHYMVPLAYAQMQVLGQAIEGTRSLDDLKLSAYTQNATFQTVMGDVQFGRNGEWSRPRVLQVQFQGIEASGIQQFRNGSRQIIVSPPEFASGRLLFPYADARG